MLVALALGSGLSSVILGFLGAMMIVEDRRVHDRMAALVTSPGDVDPEIVDAYLDRQSQALAARLLSPLARLLDPLIRADARKRMRLKLLAAGMLRHMGESEFTGLRAVCAVGGAFEGLLTYHALAARDPTCAVVAAGIAALATAALPDRWLRGQIQRRQARIRRILPEVIDLLIVSIEAGTSFDAAMACIEARSRSPIAEEFHRALQEMRLGKPRASALRDMARRTGMDEVSVLVSAVIQADQLGVGMAQALLVQADALRHKRIHRAREKAQKLQVQILFPLVFFIFPALFVVVLGPAVISISDALGW